MNKKVNKDVVGPSFDSHLNEMNLTDEGKAIIEFEEMLIKTIVALRKEQNLTQKEISEILDLNPSQVCRFEKGRNDPQLSMVIRYLAHLGKMLSIVDINTHESMYIK